MNLIQKLRGLFSWKPEPLTHHSAYDASAELIAGLRATEANMTSAQKIRAFLIAEENGWPSGSNPPPYCWATFFQQAIQEVPATTTLDAFVAQDGQPSHTFH